MKKLFSSLLLCLAVLTASAQETLKRAVTVNFEDLASLTPKMAFDKDTSAIALQGLTFTTGQASVRFTSTTGVNRASIKYRVQGKSGYSYADCISGSRLVISVGNDYDLVGVRFINGSTVGGFQLDKGSKGTFKFFDQATEWRAEENGTPIDGVKQISLTNVQFASEIRCLEITYRSPLNVLRCTASSPTDEVESLGNIRLQFTHAVTSAPGAPFAISGSQSTFGTPVFEGNTVTLTASTPVTASGTHTVTFPARSFVTAEGYYNDAFTRTFTVQEPQNTFMPEPIPGGQIERIQQAYTLAFPTAVGNMAELPNVTLDVYRRGEAAPCGYAKFKQGADDKTVTMTIGGVSYTQPTVFTIKVPEKTFFNYLYGDNTNRALRWNAAFEMKFWKAGVETPSAEVVARATEVLANNGVGYPSATSASRTALTSMIETQDQSDAKFEAAIAAFYAEQDITMPEDGHWYTVCNKQKDGTVRYLSYDGAKVTLAATGTAFKAVAAGTEWQLMTSDGRYLTPLASEGNYSLAPKSSVSTTATALTVAKLAGDDAEAVFGLMTLSGNIGKRLGAGDDVTAFSTVKSDGTIIEGETQAYFTDMASSAFLLTETAKPEIVTKYTVTVYPESQGSIEDLEKIVITFPNVTAISYDQTKDITLTSPAYKPIACAVSVEGNTVTLTAAQSLRNGTYTLVAPKGAFTWSDGTETVTVPDITAQFTVYVADDYLADLNNLYRVTYTPNIDTVNQLDLNSICIELQHDDFTSVESYADPSADVLLTDNFYEVNNKVYAHGSLSTEVTPEQYVVLTLRHNGEYVGDVAWHDESSYILTDQRRGYLLEGDVIGNDTLTRNRYKHYLTFTPRVDNTVFRDGSLVANIHFPEAAIGDATFKRMLDGGNVKHSECHVTKPILLAYMVNSRLTPTGITEVASEAGTRAEGIYDLSGRRLVKATRPGLYIIGGRKVVVK